MRNPYKYKHTDLTGSNIGERQMEKLINNHVIFSIDNPFDTHQLARFTRFVDELYALQRLKYEVKVGIGSYQNNLEPCFMMDYNDFYKHVIHTPYLQEQESILVLNPRNYRTDILQGTLHYLDGSSSVYLGLWEPRFKEEAIKEEAWTCFNGSAYYVCQK